MDGKHYDGDDPQAPLAPSHFSEAQRAEARHLGDGSPGIEPRASDAEAGNGEIEQTTRYGMGMEVELEYAAAVARTKEELAKEGFGVLSEIDIAATLKQKLGADFRPYVILGACNPPLAHRALLAERDLGLLLPCNVIVYGSDAAGRSVVAAMDPEATLELTGNHEVREVAREVKARLGRVLAGVSRTAAD